jgi:thiamine-monophosphate kinase
MSEFSIIQQYFLKEKSHNPEVILGIGDDGAIVANDALLCISKDLLVEGVHFYSDDPAHSIGHRIAAVNLSDMAAMGACPRYALLGLAMQRERSENQRWLSEFTEGLYNLLTRYNTQIIGGDTTRSDRLTLSLTIIGELSKNTQPLTRHQARDGDDVWVSGMIGLAGLALAGDTRKECLHKRLYPEPRIPLGMALSKQCLAHAAIDVSDGLLADIQHIAQSSQCDIVIDLDTIPCITGLNAQQRWNAYISGEDYELCFTSDKKNRSNIVSLTEALNIPLTRIGYCKKGSGILYNAQQQILSQKVLGYDHFQSTP